MEGGDLGEKSTAWSIALDSPTLRVDDYTDEELKVIFESMIKRKAEND